MRKRYYLISVGLIVSTLMFGQGAKNIKINEVLTNNTANLIDDFGERLPWVELANTAFSTYNVRNMYITTDTSVLNPQMPVPERIKRMSLIPSHDKCTELKAKQHLVLYLNSNPTKGARHLSAKVNPGEPLWIALYDGNAIDLIDSISIPALPENASYAKKTDQSLQWVVKAAGAVTPGTDNFIQVTETKVSKLKRNDPYGVGITVLSMGIVFGCLALLYIFFTVFGIFMKRQQAKKEIKEKERTKSRTEEFAKTLKNHGIKTYEKEIYMAVIAMALKEYQDNAHDIESGVITIRPKHTSWSNVKQ